MAIVDTGSVRAVSTHKVELQVVDPALPVLPLPETPRIHEHVETSATERAQTEADVAAPDLSTNILPLPPSSSTNTIVSQPAPPSPPRKPMDHDVSNTVVTKTISLNGQAADESLLLHDSSHDQQTVRGFSEDAISHRKDLSHAPTISPNTDIHTPTYPSDFGARSHPYGYPARSNNMLLGDAPVPPGISGDPEGLPGLNASHGPLPNVILNVSTISLAISVRSILRGPSLHLRAPRPTDFMYPERPPHSVELEIVGPPSQTSSSSSLPMPGRFPRTPSPQDNSRPPEDESLCCNCVIM